jgi:hypothetical protein
MRKCLGQKRTNKEKNTDKHKRISDHFLIEIALQAAPQLLK